MTDERYREWTRDIAQARADGDHTRLASLQLDYNLELGECLAHQSQRTKDIKGELAGVRQHVGEVGTEVRLLNTRFSKLEDAAIRTADSVGGLAQSVKDLIAYRNGLVVENESRRLAGRTVKALVIGASVIVSWAYAIYQAFMAYYGN